MKWALILIGLVQLFLGEIAEAQTPKLLGTWTVEVTFENGQNRSLQFEARESGKGSFALVGAGQKGWAPPQTGEVTWTNGKGSLVVISGPVQFPLGNVGIERGTLVLKGELGAAGGISGVARFIALDRTPEDPIATPSKIGTFKAIRAPAERREKPDQRY